MAEDDYLDKGNAGGIRKAGLKKRKLPTEERLTRSALYYLSRYASSAENLRKILYRKVKRSAQDHGRSPDEFTGLIDQVVVKCQNSGLADDRSYAETKLAGFRRRGRSQMQISAALVAKGVARDVIAETLSRDETTDLEAAATYARRRKLGPWRTRGSRDDHAGKDMAALCRAGFSFDIACKVIKAALDADGEE